MQTDCAVQALSLFAAWEARDYDGVMAHMAKGARVTDMPRGLVLDTPSDIRAWMTSWVTACSDATGGAQVRVASADGAVVQGVYAGTNDGPFGPLAATGRTVSMPFSIVMRFDGDGLITEYEVYYDQLSLLTQLGHAPAMA
jgi:ketosteroid isomerase-like protein